MPAITPRTRCLTVVAQDPTVTDANGGILCAAVEIPAETLEPGPWGHRVQVIDFDATSDQLIKPLDTKHYMRVAGGALKDPFAHVADRQIRTDPNFHAQNVYATVMSVLARFEKALGRRVNWGFASHQLRIAPHAFADANAFYSPEERALLFGYFAGKDGETIYTCLSHDVIAHETAHALVDGIRTRFTDPSSPDQAAFHEGFADCVALLSTFAQPVVVEAALEGSTRHGPLRQRTKRAQGASFISMAALTRDALAKSMLLGLAEQMGDELNGIRGGALRQSAELKASRTLLKTPVFLEPHRRGEVFVAAMMQTFLEVWTTRLETLRRFGRLLNVRRVAEEGSAAADYLLTMAIRALDYTPPVHLEFSDFLSAMLTADSEIRPDDGIYQYRRALLARFRAFGIDPASHGTATSPGVWTGLAGSDVSIERLHFDEMRRDPDELFSFVWENRKALRLQESAYTRVISVRPCVRVAPDGFVLRETVAEVSQRLDVTAGELGTLKIKRPREMARATPIDLHGGSTLIFDEFGRLKYEVHNDILDGKRQTARIANLFASGYYDQGASPARQFAEMHLRRAVTSAVPRQEW